MVRLGIRIGPEPSGIAPQPRVDLTMLQGLKALGGYDLSLADQGPPGTEAASRVALVAIRRAIDHASVAPLDTPVARAAFASLRAPAARACPPR